jgi:UDP-perosamine 4-acetyltransferase
LKLVVVGAGGHARSVIDAITRSGRDEAVACTDPRADLAGTEIDGVTIVGDDGKLPSLLQSGVAGACLGIGGAGDNGPRKRLFDHLRGMGFQLPTIVHPRAIVAASAELGDAAVVLAAAVVGAGASIGENVIVNTGAVVEHDCVVGAHAHVATGALLGGGVIVEERAHIGIGASVIHGIRIGAGAIVGGGSAVVRDVEAQTTVAGCPAVPLRAGR